MQWLSLLFALGLCYSVRARGLAVDFNQETKENNEDETSPGDEFKGKSDDDVQSKKQNLNFIYQFLLGNSFGNMNKDFQVIETNDQVGFNGSEVSDNDGNLAHTNSPKLLLPPEPGAYGRQNKVYWTDEELEAVREKHNSTETSELIDNGRRAVRVIENIYPVAKNVEKLSRIFIDDYKAATEDTPAQDRQLAMSLTDLSLDSVEDIFQQMVLNLPNGIDKSREFIVEDIASNNMIGFTIVFSFFMGAALDTVADFLVEERFLTDIITDQGLWFFLGWLWFYAAGFSGPWLFPATFSGGDPNLQCSSVDFFAMLADSDLNLNIKSISSRSKGEMLILSERLRTDFNSRLGCIVHKKGDYKEAEQVHSEFQRLLGLINLHHQLTVTDQIQEDIGVLDQELRLIWDSIPLMVPDVYDAVTARRANTLGIYFFLAILNLLGAICGTLLQIVPIGLGGAPGAFGPGPGAFVPAANGQFSNDFFIGEGMFAVAQGFGWGYGYYAPYFLYMEEADPGCGVVELDNVYSRYQGLASLQVLMSTGQVRAPAVRYFVAEWRRELGVAVHCLLSTEEGTKLADTMDMFVNLVNSRLDLT